MILPIVWKRKKQAVFLFQIPLEFSTLNEPVTKMNLLNKLKWRIHFLSAPADEATVIKSWFSAHQAISSHLLSNTHPFGVLTFSEISAASLDCMYILYLMILDFTLVLAVLISHFILNRTFFFFLRDRHVWFKSKHDTKICFAL